MALLRLEEILLIFVMSLEGTDVIEQPSLVPVGEIGLAEFEVEDVGDGLVQEGLSEQGRALVQVPVLRHLAFFVERIFLIDSLSRISLTECPRGRPCSS